MADVPKKSESAAWKQRWLRRGFVALLILVVLGIVIRLMLPTLIQRTVAYGSRHYLGLPVRVGNVHLSLWNGTAIFEDVGVAAQPDDIQPLDAAWHSPPLDAASTLLHLQKITLRWSWWTLRHKTVHVTEFLVEKPTVRLVREIDGEIDPLRQAKPLTPTSEMGATESTKKTSKSWLIKIHQFILRTPHIEVLDAATQQNLLEFSLESFELSDVSIGDREFGLDAIAIRGPELRVQRELVLTDSPPTKTPVTKSTTPEPSSQAAPTSIRIHQIAMERAKFTWITKGEPLDVFLTLHASEITTEQDRHFPLDVTLQIGSGKIALAGEARIFPPHFQGTLTWNDLAFPPLLLAAQHELGLWMQYANSSGKLNITASLGDKKMPPGVVLSGHVSMDSLTAISPGTKEVSLGWNRLDLTIKEIAIPFVEEGKPLRQTKLNFERISLSSPQIYYTHPSPSLNTLTASSPSQNTENKETAAASSFDIQIGLLELANGEIILHNTSANSSTRLSDLKIHMRDLRFPSSTFDALSLRATLPSSSLLSIEGAMTASLTGSFILGIENLDLPPWSSYSKQAGVSLDAGQASLQTKLILNGTALQADNDIVLKNFGISLRDPDSFTRQFGVPLDLALALLRDPAGNIHLTIPLRMDERGTTTAMGAIITSALRTALIGTLSSPLKLLGARLGGTSGQDKSSEKNIVLESSSGSADPHPNAFAKINNLAKLLINSPNLGVQLRGRSGDADRPFLGAQLLRERVLMGEGFPNVEDSNFFARRRIHHYFEKLAKGESAVLEEKDRALYERYVAATEIPASQSLALANQRADQVKALLLAQKVNPASITVGDPMPEGSPSIVIGFRSNPKANSQNPPKKSAKPKN